MPTEKTIRFEITCIDLPGAVFGEHHHLRLGIQENKMVVQDVSADTAQVTFCFAARVREHASSGRPNFLGSFVHGTPDRRFVYLNWGERRDGEWLGLRRAKVHLDVIGWEQVNLAETEEQPIRATISMTDDRGKPVSATVSADKVCWL